MKVRDIMTKNVSSVSESSNVKDAAKIMKSLNVGFVPVCNNKKPVGVVTDRDIVLNSVASGSNNSISSVMSKNIVSVSPDSDVSEASNLMAQNKIRRLPVVENNKIVGIVSLGDLANENTQSNEAGEALSSISKPGNSIR